MIFVADLQQVLRSPFGRRIFYRLTGCILSFSLLFFCTSMLMEYRSLTNELLNDGMQLADIYAHAAHLGIFTEDNELLHNPTEALLSHLSVTAACAISRDGNLLMESGKKNDAHDEACFLGSPEAVAIRQQVLATGAARTFKTSSSFHFWAPVFVRENRFSNEELLLNQEVAQQRKQLIGAVGIVMDRSSINKSMGHLFFTYLLLNLFFVLLAVFITLRIARDASAPLRRLLQKFGISAQTGKGLAPDEITSLSGTFDRVIDDLNSAFQTINELKAGLEKRVEQRTAELAGRQEELLQANALLEKALIDLKSTQSQLVQSEKMAALGHLVAGVAHEINNTINFVSGALPPMKRTIDSIRSLCDSCDASDSGCRDRLLSHFDDLDELVANISNGASRTTRIVKDLRDFSRPDHKQPKPADIHQNLDVTLALIRPEYKHRIDIVRNFDSSIGPVSCNASQLNQVFTNLLLNAIQAIDGQGSITISTSQDREGVHIRFADSGSGIPATIIDHIFDPFFTTKEVGEGTGLGLSISYSIIKNHGGSIRVKSEVGKGAEFEIVLPAR